MADLNSFSFTGKLTKNAELRTLASGSNVLVANVAINTGYGDYKKTLFIKVQQWGESGSKIQKYLTKGSTVAGTGELSINAWTGKDGIERTSLQLDTKSIQIINSKQDSNSDSDSIINNNNVSTEEELPAF